MSYREVAGAPHMFNEFIDHNKSELQNPFLHPQPNPHPVYIPRPMPQRVAPAQLAGNPHGFGELGTFSKVKKYLWLALVAGQFAATKVLMTKYSTQIAAATARSPEFARALDDVMAVHLPATALLMAGPAFQLLVNRDWPLLTTAGVAGAVGYTALKAGPSVLPVVSELRKVSVSMKKRKKRKKKKK